MSSRPLARFVLVGNDSFKLLLVGSVHRMNGFGARYELPATAREI